MNGKSREEILGKIRSGLRKKTGHGETGNIASELDTVDKRLSEVQNRYRTSNNDSPIDQFLKELTNVNTEVHRAKSDDRIIEYLMTVISRKAIKSYAIWNTEYLNTLKLKSRLEGEGLAKLESNDKNDVARAEIGITGADYAIADTGTLVLLTDGNKPRSASLLPPIHAAIVRESDIVSNINGLFDILKQKLDAGEKVPSCMTFITGPSRTADIELNLTLGVHGPKELYVVII